VLYTATMHRGLPRRRPQGAHRGQAIRRRNLAILGANGSSLPAGRPNCLSVPPPL